MLNIEITCDLVIDLLNHNNFAPDKRLIHLRYQFANQFVSQSFLQTQPLYLCNNIISHNKKYYKLLSFILTLVRVELNCEPKLEQIDNCRTHSLTARIIGTGTTYFTNSFVCYYCKQKLTFWLVDATVRSVYACTWWYYLCKIIITHCIVLRSYLVMHSDCVQQLLTIANKL